MLDAIRENGAEATEYIVKKVNTWSSQLKQIFLLLQSVFLYLGEPNLSYDH